MKPDIDYRLPEFSRAVIIGTSKYKRSFLDRQLNSVANNLDGFARRLRDSAIWGLSPDNCKVVIDPQNSDEILNPIRLAAREATGSLLIYYAGHGMEGRVDHGLHITHSNSIDDEPSSALSFGYIRHELLNSRARNRIVILDCCHAGLAIPTMGRERLVIDGSTVMASVRGYELARAVGENGYTAYTGALVSALDRGDPRRPKILTPNDLHDIIVSMMVSRGLPVPVFAQTGNSPHLPLFKNAGIGGHIPVIPGHRPSLPYHLGGAVLVALAGALGAKVTGMSAIWSVVTCLSGALTTFGVARKLHGEGWLSALFVKPRRSVL